MMAVKAWARWAIAVLAAAAVIAVTSCGGGSGSGSSSASDSGVGSVAVLLTDGPSSRYDEVNLTITRIELIGDNGASAVVFSGERTVDLLKLSDDSEVFSLVDAPAGVYHKIRFTVTGLQLIKLNDAGEVVETVEPELPANGKIDLNPRMDFIVSGDEPLVLQLDLDADKSIQAIGLGNGRYRFRPVVFVDIVSGAALGKYVRLEGTVVDADAAARTFSLCGSRTTFHLHRDGRWGRWWRGDMAGDDAAAGGVDKDSRCVTVAAAADASIFTASGSGAAAATFADVADGSAVTVFGRLIQVQDSDDGTFTLQAQVVALGPDDDYRYAGGTVTTAYDAGSGTFALGVTRSRDFTQGSAVTVTPLAGARVFTRSGNELTLDDIKADFGVKVFGVPDAAAAQMQALVVFVNDAASAATELSGTLGALDAGNNTFTLTGTAQGDVCVRVKDHADVFLIGADGETRTSTAVTLAELSAGMTADVYGRFELTGCLAAADIIATAVSEPAE